MKIFKLILTAIIIINITKCKPKKSVTTTTVAPVSTTTATPTNTATQTTGYSVFSNPAASTDGVYVPGENELLAIQAQYSDVTLEKLKEGHMLYTVGPCVNCHGAKNIYKRETVRWKSIVDEMAKMAKLNEAQTDAVYKYVLAIKATQPK